MTNSRCRYFSIVLGAAATLLYAGSALAVSASAQARYQEDVKVCNSGQSNQERSTCLREARNALAQARRGGLTDAPQQYQDNARQRCAALSGDERSACEVRMQGGGTVQGSVAAGGVLRESVTIVPAK